MSLMILSINTKNLTGRSGGVGMAKGKQWQEELKLGEQNSRLSRAGFCLFLCLFVRFKK